MRATAAIHAAAWRPCDDRIKALKLARIPGRALTAGGQDEQKRFSCKWKSIRETETIELTRSLWHVSGLSVCGVCAARAIEGNSGSEFEGREAGCRQAVFESWSDFRNSAPKRSQADGAHATSTCRMSASDADRVVDHDLLVHGADNLYVCSNAVYPNVRLKIPH